VYLLPLLFPQWYYIVLSDPIENADFRENWPVYNSCQFFIKGYFLKKKCNAEYDLLNLHQGTGLRTDM
jgi:hypothetical protein